jgi:hypothetical protein
MKVTFRNLQEIRMGSPYNVAELVLEGRWTPNLPKEDWQDTTSQSEDGRYVGLVAWDTLDNNPGFRVYTIDTVERTFACTKRILGCCQELEWKPAIKQFVWLIA